MTNYSIDPKVLYFLQDIIVNSPTGIKSCLLDSCCDEIRKIEDIFSSEIEPNNNNVGNWITGTIDHVSKVMSLLKSYFAHWLNI